MRKLTLEEETGVSKTIAISENCFLIVYNNRPKTYK